MNDEEKHTELIELAIKKHAGEANTEEIKRLTELLDKNATYQQVYNEYVSTWELTGNAQGITQEEIQTEWNRLDQAIEGLSKPKKGIQYFGIAAAVASLIISAFLLSQYILSIGQTEIISAELSTQAMDDGSVITLNANSELYFTDDYNKDKREVQLVGEAFFDIAKNEHKPFIVKSRNTEIEVLGTSFNVTAKKSDYSTEVVVVTGKVQVTHAGDQVTLLPGEKATVNYKSGKLFKLVNDDPNFQAWRTKKFVFDDLPLAQVIALLSEVFDTSIYLANEQLGACPVTVSFDNQSLDSIIEVLTNTLDLTTTKTNKGLAIEGEGCE